MMAESIDQILSRVAAKSLEKLAFIFSFPTAEDDDFVYESAVAASVHFNGKFSGRLIIITEPQILVELTSNMLGIDDDEETTRDQQEDALKETINIICGNLLPELAGEAEVFHIDSPEIIAGTEEITSAIAGGNGQKPVSEVKLSIDDEKCALYLFGDIVKR